MELRTAEEGESPRALGPPTSARSATMATLPVPSASDDPESMFEKQRFFNFLQHYKLERYHGPLVERGVSRISHLKTVDDRDLLQIGFSLSEMNRLRRKLDENFSITGRLIVRSGL